MKEVVSEGKLVSFAYKIYDAENGELIFEATKNAPDVMIYGVSEDIIPGLAAAMKGLAPGDRFSVTLPPEAAFGPYFKDNVITLDRKIFMRDGDMASEVVLGAELPMMTEQGLMVKGRVVNIGKDDVTMDFNHPFAGKTVQFDGEVIDLRDATPEEIQKARGGCGCGCGHDHCHCDDGCHDNCHCGEHEHDDCGCGHEECHCGDDCHCGEEGYDDCGCGCGK